MRYYKYDLWINDSENEWNENSLKYEEYFQTIKSNFTEHFLKVYHSTCEFHDYNIRTMFMRDNNVLILEIVKEKNKFWIEYENVRSLLLFPNSSKESSDMQISEYLEWGYDEFYKEDDNIFTHSIITSCGLEIVVSFETVSAICSKFIFGRPRQRTVLCFDKEENTGDG